MRIEMMLPVAKQRAEIFYETSIFNKHIKEWSKMFNLIKNKNEAIYTRVCMHIYYIVLPMTPTKKLGSAMRSKILSEWFGFNFFCCAYLFMAGKWEGGGKRLFFGL